MPSAGPDQPPSTRLTFSCTACGRCCHDLRLPLSVSEAIGWIERGGKVEILCDAAPALDAAEAERDYRATRSLPARSGALPISLGVTLTAVFEGACPHLLENLYCGAYEERPNVCRIYPAELRPDRPVVAAQKLCPREAWSDQHPLFVNDEGGVEDQETASAIASSRVQGRRDVVPKRRLVGALRLNAAALANEGYAVWKPDQPSLLAALRSASLTGAASPADTELQIRIVSKRPETLRLIGEAEANAEEVGPQRPYDYIALY